MQEVTKNARALRHLRTRRHAFWYAQQVIVGCSIETNSIGPTSCKDWNSMKPLISHHIVKCNYFIPMPIVKINSIYLWVYNLHHNVLLTLKCIPLMINGFFNRSHRICPAMASMECHKRCCHFQRPFRHNFICINVSLLLCWKVGVVGL